MSKIITIQDIIKKLSPAAKAKLIKAKQPSWEDPMLATLTSSYFSDKNFLYEHKWDGERIIAYKTGDKIQLFTRNKKNANSAYPELVEALKKQKIANFIIDGEVIAMEKGQSDFGILQNVMHSKNSIEQNSKINILYCLFDVLYVDQYDVTQLELIDRKTILQHMLAYKIPLLYTEHILKDGLPYFKLACKRDWEGLIAKNIHSTYQHKRSHDWLKFKCINQQEFVIGGYTDPQGSRINFGALLLGYYKNGKLEYAGKVGTGFDTDMLELLGKKLFKLEQKKSPFSADIQEKNVHWVAPKLVAEIKFSQWTRYNKLRHPRFTGLRDDKNAKDVIKEEAKPIT